MTEYVMTIGGTTGSTRKAFGVVNPATGKVFAEAPDCSREQLDTAMDSAAKAHRDWRTDINARREALRAAAHVLFGAGEELGPVLSAEQGKPVNEAAAEAQGAGLWFKYYADLELPREIIQDDDSAVVEILRRPLGVVAAIAPWNYPILLAAWKIAPALLAGNTIVLKPSPFTPLATLKLGELLNSVLPAGVLNIVSGGDELGAWMTAHRTPRKISFTGSVGTGKLVAAAAAPDLKRVTLELGGNDAAIVLDDVDPAAVAEKLFWGAFLNNGQVCTAIKRLYVSEAIHDELIEALAEQARAVKVGEGTVDGVQLGPINNRAQFDRVSGLVSDALQNGARAVVGGRPMDRAGYFYEPTILAGALDGTRIVDEEQFGPALPVMSYRHIADAVEKANATQFGLSGSVWSTDPERAAAVAEQLECGTAWVNTHMVLQPHQPFGGTKSSGLGVENGPWGFYGFTELQVQYRAKSYAQLS